MLKSIKHACIYDLSASGTRPLFDIHSIIGNPFLKFLATPLAVVVFPEQFRPYLLGTPFTLCTDHGALTWIQKFNPFTAVDAIWRL